jgi:hypothetical protein
LLIPHNNTNFPAPQPIYVPLSCDGWPLVIPTDNITTKPSNKKRIIDIKKRFKNVFGKKHISLDFFDFHARKKYKIDIINGIPKPILKPMISIEST